MRPEDHELSSAISKTIEDLKLYESEQGIVEIREGTLVIPIELEDEERGYIFHGHGKLLLDTTVETEEGAVGKPVEKELEKPFLMLGDSARIPQCLKKVSQEDFTTLGYKERQEFMDNAENLLDRFLKNEGKHRQSHGRHQDGLIFAFQNQAEKLDFLAVDGSKLVYASKDKVFVANKNNIILNSLNAVVCSSNGKSVIMNKGKSLIAQKDADFA